MNADQLNKWLALVANLGVIAGILFLAFEIRQSNRIAIASNEITIRQTWASHNESTYGNPEIIELLYKARDPDVEFSGEEREALIFYVARLFNTWGAIERAHNNEMASVDTLNAAFDDLRVTIETYPALVPIIRDQVADYPAHGGSVMYRTAKELLNSE